MSARQAIGVHRVARDFSAHRNRGSDMHMEIIARSIMPLNFDGSVRCIGDAVRRMLTFRLPMLATTIASAPAIAQNDLQHRALQRAGCYALQWGVPASTQRGLVAGTIPPVVWLTAAPIQLDSSLQDYPRFVMRPAPGHRQSEYALETWLLTQADTIVLMWDSDFHGVAARLGVVDSRNTDHLAGQARSWSDAIDAGPFGFSTDIAADRVSCRG